MITRLRISGFKNLNDVDIAFGPLTCIAGPNEVGKSNLFDAIEFLSATARMHIAEAARSLRPAAGEGWATAMIIWGAPCKGVIDPEGARPSLEGGWPPGSSRDRSGGNERSRALDVKGRC